MSLPSRSNASTKSSSRSEKYRYMEAGDIPASQELYAEITVNEMRNQLIVDDVANSYENGRNSLVLTERTAHVELLAKKLSEKVPDVIALTGGMSAKETREILTKISNTPPDKQLTLVAFDWRRTGRSQPALAAAEGSE